MAFRWFCKKTAKERHRIGDIWPCALHTIGQASNFGLTEALFFIVDVVSIVEIEPQSFLMGVVMPLIFFKLYLARIPSR